MLSARRLLQEAEKFYDGSPSLSSSAQGDAWRTAFSSGADWMRLAMAEVRKQTVPMHTAPFGWLGFAKYTLASTSALLVVAAACLCKCWILLPLVVPAFYGVEVQWVFLFPVAIDGSTKPWADSRALMRRHAGTLVMMSFVLPFAWRMLTGGFFGKGFVRSWCVGCLAVVLLYERFRNASPIARGEDEVSLLEIGARSPLLIREEKIVLPVSASVRMLLISDLHLRSGSSERLLCSIDSALQTTAPQVVVFGGDFADAAGGLAALEKRLPSWSRACPWVAVPGNHDHWLGIERVKEALITAGVHWLPDQPYSLCRDDMEILRFASLVSDSRAATSTSLPKPSCPLVIVAHDPADFPKAQHAGSDLVLAGHLHGCQWVLAKREERLLPGQWFYRWNVLRAEAGGAKLIVSRGCGDTLPVRWNCPREVVCCDLIPSSSIV